MLDINQRHRSQSKNTELRSMVRNWRRCASAFSRSLTFSSNFVPRPSGPRATRRTLARDDVAHSSRACAFTFSTPRRRCAARHRALRTAKAAPARSAQAAAPIRASVARMYARLSRAIRSATSDLPERVPPSTSTITRADCIRGPLAAPERPPPGERSWLASDRARVRLPALRRPRVGAVLRSVRVLPR